MIWEPHWTFPGHEPDLAPLIRRFEWDLRKSLEQGAVIGNVGALSEEQAERVLATTLDVARRSGVPAVRARFEDEVIVVEVARPRGVG